MVYRPVEMGMPSRIRAPSGDYLEKQIYQFAQRATKRFSFIAGQISQVTGTWHLSYACIGFGVVSFPPLPFCSAILNTSTHMACTAEPVCSLFCDGHHDGLGKSSQRTLLVVDIDFDLHSQVVVVSCPCPPVVVHILIVYANSNTSYFSYSFPE